MRSSDICMDGSGHVAWSGRARRHVFISEPCELSIVPSASPNRGFGNKSSDQFAVVAAIFSVE